MNLALDDNKFLNELESIASSTTKRRENSSSLTLKRRQRYLGRRVIRIDITENWDIDTIDSESTQLFDSSAINSGFGRFIKRCCDLIGSIIGLVLSIPFWILLPLLIKLGSRGPVLYTQTRVGRNRRESRRRTSPKESSGNSRKRERRRENSYGQTFKVIKFRTMVHHAERESGPVWAAHNDSRITRIGKIMRKLRLDEIPQFLNVLAGDMSLIGPRPERPNFVRDLSDKFENYSARLECKPGITGLAQVKGTYDSSSATVAEKLKYDLEYIDNWSLWLDFNILLRTVKVVLTGRGAR